MSKARVDLKYKLTFSLKKIVCFKPQLKEEKLVRKVKKPIFDIISKDLFLKENIDSDKYVRLYKLHNSKHLKSP